MDQGNRARQALSVLRKAACRAACLAEAQPDAGWSGVAKVISIRGQGSEVETLNLRAASLQYRPRLVGNQTADASRGGPLYLGAKTRKQGDGMFAARRGWAGLVAR